MIIKYIEELPTTKVVLPQIVTPFSVSVAAVPLRFIDTSFYYSTYPTWTVLFLVLPLPLYLIMN